MKMKIILVSAVVFCVCLSSGHAQDLHEEGEVLEVVEEVAEVDDVGRERRALDVGDIAISPETAKLVGKTFRFPNLTTTNKARGVTLTLGGVPINLNAFTVTKSNERALDNFLRDEPLQERMYVAAKLAEIEQKLAAKEGKRLTRFAVESLNDPDEDIVYDREDVDDMLAALEEDSAPKVISATSDTSTGTSPTGPGNQRVKRKVKESGKWGTTIRYKITNDFNSYPSSKNAINAAIKLWEDETCLDFKKISFYIGPHLRFKRKTGCWSKVGRKLLGQTVSIGPGCGTTAIVAHEIGHALGFWHEQSRPDRGSYVNIHSSNIKSGKSHNFARKSWKKTLALGIPYDYASVMHYRTTSFSKNGLKTISTKVADMDSTIGQRHGLSFYDVKMMNYRYCSSKCGGLTWSACGNDGYRDPKNCNKCKCPDGWTGTFCTIPQDEVNADCGTKYLTATTSWKTLKSPLYDTTGYPGNSECTWRIRAYGNGRRVEMKFDDLKFHSGTPCNSYVEVRSKHMARSGPRYCGYSTPSQTFLSHGNDMLLLLRNHASSSRKGFQLKYRLAKCGGCSGVKVETACRETQTYSCPGVYYKRCGFLWTKKCKRTRANTCYREVKTCCEGRKLVGNVCYRVDFPGEWTPWSSWSGCSKPCGACGTRKRTRTCLSPPCSGSSIQTQTCNKQPCSSNVSYKCSYQAKTSTGWFWNKKTKYVTRYKLCYSKCCGGKTVINGQCV